MGQGARAIGRSKERDMEILVVSGCLGAGKTTFIQELLRRGGKDAVIYENEYGEADIDARRLRADSDLQVWESVENCICCSGRQDFASSVLTISSSLDPELLIVEPTGVARLGNVLENLSQIEWERISLLAPIVVVDSVSWQEQRRRAREVFDDQLANAAGIVVSKLGASSDVEAIRALAQELNPQAEFMALPYDDIPDTWWNNLLSRSREGEPVVIDASATPSPELETMTLEQVELPSPAHLIWLLDALSAGVFGRMARAKGSVACGGQTLRFDLVERAWAITGEEGSEGARCVFIGENLLRSGLREAFVPALWRRSAKLYHVHEHHHDHNQH